MPAAVQRLKDSSFAREVFPALLIDTYIDTIEYEYEQVTAPVSDIERQRYIGAL